MSAKADSEARLLSASEVEIVNATQEPEIGQLTLDQLKSVGRRLRQAHDRAKDISARQRREMRGKADPRGAKREHWRRCRCFLRLSSGLTRSFLAASKELLRPDAKI